MTDDDTTPTAAQLTRRDTLRSGGALASLLGGGVTHDLAGGPAADAMSEHRVPLYRVPEPDLDSPGVVGRRVEITAGGSTYAAGDQLVDTGSSWERISPGYDSLNTDVTAITDGDGPSILYRDPSTGDLITENFDTPQDAIDNLPRVGDNDAPSGTIYVPSVGTDAGTGEGYTGRMVVDNDGNPGFDGGILKGSGIHDKFDADTSDPLVLLKNEDWHLHHFWLDNDGTGSNIQTWRENYISHINIDQSESIAIEVVQEVNVIGPGIEIKKAPTAAVKLQNNARDNKIHGINIVQYASGVTIKSGFDINGPDNLIQNSTIMADGRDGWNNALIVRSGGTGTKLSNITVKATPKVSGSTGPSDAFKLLEGGVRGSTLEEDGSAGNGIGIYADISNVRMSGNFPSGIYFDSDCTTVGGVVIDAPKQSVADVTEATAGYASGQVLNGQFIEPPTIDMGGSSGSITLPDAPVNPYQVKVNPNGSNVSIEGINGVAEDGKRVTVLNVGSNTVTMSHNGSGSNPLFTKSRSNESVPVQNITTYEYNGDNGSWREVAQPV